MTTADQASTSPPSRPAAEGQAGHDLGQRAIDSGRQIGQQVKRSSAKAYQLVRQRPRLVTGLVILSGVAITALLLRRRIPDALDKLTAAAAGVAIAAGAPEALDRLRSTGKKLGRSDLVSRSRDFLEDAPSRLADAGERIGRQFRRVA